jgi:hypothetical protein
MYFDINRKIKIDMLKIEAILLHSKGADVLIAIDSNSKSISWQDILTNRGGRIPYEQLHTLKESAYTTLRSRRGTSNIDVIVISFQLLNTVVEWEISEQESCSDHSIFQYAIGQGADHTTATDDQELRYIVKRDNEDNFSET